MDSTVNGYFRLKHSIKKFLFRGVFFILYSMLLLIDMLYLKKRGRTPYFYVLASHRIGNFSIDIDTYLRRCQIDSEFAKKKIIFIVGHNICNHEFLKLVRNYCCVISGTAGNMLRFMRPQIKKTKYYIQLGAKNNEYQLYQNANRTIFFNQNEQSVGKKIILDRLGIDIDKQKYVCVFARDQAYLNTMVPKKNWDHHVARNNDINNLVPSIQYLIEQGFSVIRMGSHVTHKVNFSHPQFFDYPYLNVRTEFLDLFLIMNCFLMIGSASGLCDLTGVFDIPYLGINYAPFLSAPWRKKTLYIPKKVIDQYECVMSYYDLFQQSKKFECIDFYNGAAMKESFQLDYIENTPAQILAAVKDMLVYIDNGFELSMGDQALMQFYYQAWAYNKKFSEIQTALAPSWLKENMNLYVAAQQNKSGNRLHSSQVLHQVDTL